ncbi:hypothetical protein EDB80DRAFT_884437 [Ilyonectria destructans]|nr:hypothetical protein EDB80DRAFT_884437 [Ilyonectria destructans]
MALTPIVHSSELCSAGDDPNQSKYSSFPLFSALPSELRQQIWRIAFLSRTPSIVSVEVSSNTGDPHLSFKKCGGPSIAIVALACVEAFKEWSCISRYFLGALLPRQYIPHTIFLLQSPLRVIRLLRAFSTPFDLATQVRHVSFVIVPNTTLTGIFSALASFPRLETIVLIVPACLARDDMQLDSLEDSPVTETLAELLNHTSIEGQCPEQSDFSLLLRGRRPSQAVMAFYARENAPQVKFLTPQHNERHCRIHEN